MIIWDFYNLLSSFTKPEIDIDELVDFIAEGTHIDRGIIEIILEAEDIYLREKGIIYQRSGSDRMSLFSFQDYFQ